MSVSPARPVKVTTVEVDPEGAEATAERPVLFPSAKAGYLCPLDDPPGHPFTVKEVRGYEVLDDGSLSFACTVREAIEGGGTYVTRLGPVVGAEYGGYAGCTFGGARMTYYYDAPNAPAGTRGYMFLDLPHGGYLYAITDGHPADVRDVDEMTVAGRIRDAGHEGAATAVLEVIRGTVVADRSETSRSPVTGLAAVRYGGDYPVFSSPSDGSRLRGEAIAYLASCAERMHRLARVLGSGAGLSFGSGRPADAFWLAQGLPDVPEGAGRPSGSGPWICCARLFDRMGPESGDSAGGAHFDLFRMRALDFRRRLVSPAVPDSVFGPDPPPPRAWLASDELGPGESLPEGAGIPGFDPGNGVDEADASTWDPPLPVPGVAYDASASQDLVDSAGGDPGARSVPGGWFWGDWTNVPGVAAGTAASGYWYPPLVAYLAYLASPQPVDLVMGDASTGNGVPHGFADGYVPAGTRDEDHVFAGFRVVVSRADGGGTESDETYGPVDVGRAGEPPDQASWGGGALLWLGAGRWSVRLPSQGSWLRPTADFSADGPQTLASAEFDGGDWHVAVTAAVRETRSVRVRDGAPYDPPQPLEATHVSRLFGSNALSACFGSPGAAVSSTVAAPAPGFTVTVRARREPSNHDVQLGWDSGDAWPGFFEERGWGTADTTVKFVSSDVLDAFGASAADGYLYDGPVVRVHDGSVVAMSGDGSLYRYQVDGGFLVPGPGSGLGSAAIAGHSAAAEILNTADGYAFPQVPAGPGTGQRGATARWIAAADVDMVETGVATLPAGYVPDGVAPYDAANYVPAEGTIGKVPYDVAHGGHYAIPPAGASPVSGSAPDPCLAVEPFAEADPPVSPTPLATVPVASPDSVEARLAFSAVVELEQRMEGHGSSVHRTRTWRVAGFVPAVFSWTRAAGAEAGAPVSAGGACGDGPDGLWGFVRDSVLVPCGVVDPSEPSIVDLVDAGSHVPLQKSPTGRSWHAYVRDGESWTYGGEFPEYGFAVPWYADEAKLTAVVSFDAAAYRSGYCA